MSIFARVGNWIGYPTKKGLKVKNLKSAKKQKKGKKR